MEIMTGEQLPAETEKELKSLFAQVDFNLYEKTRMRNLILQNDNQNKDVVIGVLCDKITALEAKYDVLANEAQAIYLERDLLKAKLKNLGEVGEREYSVQCQGCEECMEVEV